MRISTEEYQRRVLEDFSEEITETLETPAVVNLFNVRSDNKQEILNKTWSQAFHHAVSQLLFTGIRYREDAQTDIYFLTKRARKPDEDNWKKLRSLLRYLK